MAPEEPTIILPEVSIEVLAAFIMIIYEGYCVLSSSNVASEVDTLRDLMSSFGLSISANRWNVYGLPPSLQQVGEDEPEPVPASHQGRTNTEVRQK